MNRIRQTAAVIGVALAMLLATCVARAQVMQQMPGDALLVLKVNNLSAVNEKVTKLANDLGIVAVLPPEHPASAILKDPLAALQAQTGMQQGVNLKGELGIAFLDPASVGGNEEDALLMLVPVSDYKAFLSNWPDAKTEGEISEVKLADAPKPAYTAKWGNYAAMSPSKAFISKKPATNLTIPALTTKELSARDLILYVNWNSLRGKLQPELAKGRTEMLAHFDEGIKNVPQLVKYSPVIKALLGQIIQVADQYLADAEAATVGLSIIPDQGLTATMMSEFKPNSYIATNVTAQKNTDASLLEGLPDGKYLFFGGNVADPQATMKVITDFLAPISKELAAGGADMKPIQDYIDSIKAYASAVKGQSVGVLAPSGMIGADSVLQVLSVQSGDAHAMATAYGKMIESQQALMKSLNIPGAEAMKPVHTPAAKTLDGVTFDSVVTKVDMNAQDPRAMQQAQMMTMLYGPQGQVAHYGVVGDKLLMAMCVKDQMISSAIAAVKARSAPLAATPGVKGVAAQLPKQRLAAVFVPVDTIITTVLGYARQFGAGVNLQLPPDPLPPLGATVATEGNAMRVDVHVPTQLVQSLIAAGMQAAAQMNGGPKGGGL
jgi:hypothetical protein